MEGPHIACAGEAVSFIEFLGGKVAALGSGQHITMFLKGFHNQQGPNSHAPKTLINNDKFDLAVIVLVLGAFVAFNAYLFNTNYY